MNSTYKYRFSLIAGTFAAGGSFFGKLPSYLSTLALVDSSFFYLNYTVSHVLPLGLMIICNILNWRYYLKALQLSEQTLTTTVLTAATNYIVSFFFGVFFYNETFTIFSIIGAAFIVSGLWLFSDAQVEEKKKES